MAFITKKKPWSLLWLIAIQFVVDILIVGGCVAVDIANYKPVPGQSGFMFPTFTILAFILMAVITLLVIIVVMTLIIYNLKKKNNL